jgi:hypothetical protein
MIALAQEYHKPDESIGILPWWHRVLYLHVAGTTLMAATLPGFIHVFDIAVLEYDYGGATCS